MSPRAAASREFVRLPRVTRVRAGAGPSSRLLRDRMFRLADFVLRNKIMSHDSFVGLFRYRGAYMSQLYDEIHPGEILYEDFMKPMGISAPRLAADIDVPPSRVSELVHGRRPVTADTALRLGLYFGMEPRFWLNLQAEYDMRVAMRETKDKLASRIRVFHPHAA